MRGWDILALCMGVVLMAIGLYRPWEPADANATFSLGVGLSFMPMAYWCKELLSRS